MTENQEKEIIEFYLAPNSMNDTVKNFNLANRYQLHKILNKYNIKQHDEATKRQLQKQNAESTCLEKFGVKCNFASKDPKLNGKAGMLKNYGVEHPYQSKELLEKMQQTKIGKYGNYKYNNVELAAETNKEKYGGTGFAVKELNEKSKQTCEQLYGDPNYNNRESYHKTCLAKYGVSHYAQTTEYLQKAYDSKKLHKTFTTSGQEESFYNFACSVFGKEDVIRQYKSIEYPYTCDFYIKSLDAYIELNINWTHGSHKFNSFDRLDQKKLALWEEKAKESKYYQNAIEVWTRRDLEKFRTAEQNSLNYLAFYTEEEANNWLESLRKE